MTHIFYNPLSNNGTGKQQADKLSEILNGEELVFTDITGNINLWDHINGLPEGDKAVISGGDGTIHYIINKFGGNIPECPIYYFATGCGNDFKRDVASPDNEQLIPLNNYIKDLPSVSVNGGESIRFLNGIGFGIDGFCCEEADKIKQNSTKPINYAAIAIKGILGAFKTRNAVVTVDGVKHEYKHVWLVPTMNGHYYGGGMNIAPGQDRLNPERTLTAVVFHCKNKLKTLITFPKIFKGTHIEKKKIVEILVGRKIEVEFDRPTPLQVDGETYLNISRYTVVSANSAESKDERLIMNS